LSDNDRVGHVDQQADAAGRELRVGLDQYPAARWIRLRPTLKKTRFRLLGYAGRPELLAVRHLREVLAIHPYFIASPSPRLSLAQS
ncbi:MAG: hypothetical protein IT378_12040, partial [Sandaracinaceae bacterium]|nr:hypothetical protein [Sandaracinaceae bacterium]